LYISILGEIVLLVTLPSLRKYTFVRISWQTLRALADSDSKNCSTVQNILEIVFFKGKMVNTVLIN
jgi:hypothetical protein